MALSSVQYRIPRFWIWKSSRFRLKTKNLLQPYQSSSRGASNSSRHPEKWSFCPLHLLHLREETASGEYWQGQRRRLVSIPISYETKPAFSPRHLPVFHSQALPSHPRVFIHLFPLKLKRVAQAMPTFSQVFLRAVVLPYHLMFIFLCIWTENMQIILLANAKYGTTKSSTNNSSASGHRFGKTVYYYTLGLYRHKEEYCSEVWVILQPRKMNVHLSTLGKYLWLRINDALIKKHMFLMKFEIQCHK